jgi:hypothetical protein
MQHHVEQHSPEDTRELATAYREYVTGNPLLKHMLRERADDLDKQAEEDESNGA